MVQRDNISDVDLSIRFKHGNQTVFLFVDPTRPFNLVREELLEVLKERYPGGLISSTATMQKTSLPKDPQQIEFAVPKVPLDLTQGWTPLHIKNKDTPATLKVQDNSMVAFAIRPEDADEDEDLDFEVDFPSYEEEEEEA
ncbi:hypothetical protein F4780DRAFT_740897 [Xylariomycetidae sp. FL0641]|nr:hypothetical protein F4780DRAFT_740897 [Xylariomycetidae sp. FL0641]